MSNACRMLRILDQSYYSTLHHNWSKAEVSCPKLKLLSQYQGKYINFKITWITLEPSFDHLFATYSYTSYWRVSEFLTNSDRRSSYLPKFGRYRSVFHSTFFFVQHFFCSTFFCSTGHPLTVDFCREKHFIWSLNVATAEVLTCSFRFQIHFRNFVAEMTSYLFPVRWSLPRKASEGYRLVLRYNNLNKTPRLRLIKPRNSEDM